MGKITRNELAPVLVEELDSYVKNPGVATTTNVGNAYAVTLNPIPAAYENGMGLILTINADSTGDATINVNNLGAIPIKKANGNPVNNLKANGVYSLRYSPVQSAFILMGEGGEYGNASQNDVIEGKTIGTENGLVTGTMPLRHANNGVDETGNNHHHASKVAIIPGALHFKPNPLDDSRVAYEGDTWVSHYDASLNPDLIIQGKPILGVEGNIPNYGRSVLGQGYVYAQNYKADGGGSLVIEPKWGYYEAGVNNSGFGSIMITDPNYKATSIVRGKSIFGLDGVVDIGRQFASGLATSGSTVSVTSSGGSSYGWFQTITVSGLSFTPSIVICKWSATPTSPYPTFMVMNGQTNVDGYPIIIIGDTAYRFNGSLYMTQGGFCMPVYQSGSYYWYAIE